MAALVVDRLSMLPRRWLELGSHGTSPASDVQNVAKAWNLQLWLIKMEKSIARVAMPRTLGLKALALGRELERLSILSEEPDPQQLGSILRSTAPYALPTLSSFKPILTKNKAILPVPMYQ